MFSPACRQMRSDPSPDTAHPKPRPLMPGMYSTTQQANLCLVVAWAAREHSAGSFGISLVCEAILCTNMQLEAHP